MARDELQKHTLNLRRGDFDYLGTVFLPKGVDVSLVIRKLVSNYVDGLRKQETDMKEPPQL